MLSQFLLPAVATGIQNGKLQSADGCALKKLRQEPFILQRKQKRKRLIAARRFQPVPVRKQLSGCFGVSMQRRPRDVQKPPPHFDALCRAVCKYIVQNTLP